MRAYRIQELGRTVEFDAEPKMIGRAGIDIRSPSKEGILKLVEYLAEAETEFQDEKTVRENLRKRQKWAHGE